jgi:hypothetical protein
MPDNGSNDRQRSGRNPMNIRLSAHSEQLVKEHLANGAYHSPEEVIEHALVGCPLVTDSA